MLEPAGANHKNSAPNAVKKVSGDKRLWILSKGKSCPKNMKLFVTVRFTKNAKTIRTAIENTATKDAFSRFRPANVFGVCNKKCISTIRSKTANKTGVHLPCSPIINLDTMTSVDCVG